MPNLNSRYPPEERYRAFIDHQSGVLVGLSGPGTGKTNSLILRIKELVENRNIPAENIWYLTFIREIAHAFRTDLKEKYGDVTKVEHLKVNTLHSLALRLIRNRGYSIGLAGHLHVLSYVDQDDPLARIALEDLFMLLGNGKNIGSPAKLRPVFRMIKSDWANGRNPEGYGGTNSAALDSYNKYSRAFKLLDWDELIPLASTIYANATIRPDWLKSLVHLLIDEYQDFNVAEQKFLSLILENAESSVIVGDDYQSIYSGRGASPAGIREQLENVQNITVNLVICRRSQKQIVRAANKFLSYMTQPPRLLIEDQHKSEGTVSVKSFPSCRVESDYLARRLSEILTGMNETTPPDGKVICLFPSWDVLRQYQKELKEERGINCKARDRANTLDEKAWLRICARLAVYRQPFLERVLVEHFPVLRKKRKTIVAAMINGVESIAEALNRLSSSSGWGAVSQNDAIKFESFLRSLQSGDPDLVTACFNEVLAGSRQAARDTVEKFLSEAEEIKLDEYVDKLISDVFGEPKEEWIETDSSQKGVFEPYVELSTMHGSKGLTRRWVFMPGLEQCWLPGSASGEKLEEMKRIFFVALTRATEEVCISYPRTRARGDSLNYKLPGRGKPSVFATQLGVDVEIIRL